MAPLKAWCLGVFKPVKKCFNSVKLCIAELSQIYLGWFFLQFIPVLLIMKGLILNVVLPLADIATDLAFTYSMYKEMNFTLILYMNSDDYKNDTCFDFTTNATFTPSNRSFLWVDLSQTTPSQKSKYPPSDSNITCIESRSGLEYTPLTYPDAHNFFWFLMSGNNALFNYKDRF